MTKKRKTLKSFLWIALAAIVIADIFATQLGWVPAIGDLSAMTVNIITEVIEIGIVLGLLSVRNKR